MRCWSSDVALLTEPASESSPGVVGRDGVDPDLLGRELDGQRPGEARHRGLHGGVDRITRGRPVRLDGGDVDDAATPLPAHARHGELGGVQQPCEIRTDQGIPPPGVRLGEGLPERAADHVDQDIAPGAEAGVGLVEERRKRIGVPRVELGGHHLRTGIGDHRRHLVERRGVPVGQREMHTGSGQVDGAGAADATPAAHHNGHTAGQIGPFVEIAHGRLTLSWSFLRGHCWANRERRCLRSTFPKSVMGSSVSTRRCSGCLKLAIRPWQNWRSCARSSGSCTTTATPTR